MTTPDAARNAWGLTMKQEKFVQAVAAGDSQSAAYRLAYDVGESTAPSTVHVEASKLMDNPKISHRLQVLLEEQQERMLRDGVRLKQHVMRRLVEESEVNAELKTTAMSRLRALELLGKTNIVRIFAEEREGEKKDAAEIERELMDKIREFFKPKA